MNILLGYMIECTREESYSPPPVMTAEMSRSDGSRDGTRGAQAGRYG